MQARRICSVRSCSVKLAVMVITMPTADSGLTMGSSAPIVLRTYVRPSTSQFMQRSASTRSSPGSAFVQQSASLRALFAHLQFVGSCGGFAQPLEAAGDERRHALGDGREIARLAQ